MLEAGKLKVVEVLSEYLIIDNEGIINNNNGEDLIKELFKELFEVALNNCKFWVNILGRFNAVFIKNIN
jgi:hypothetical protein